MKLDTAPIAVAATALTIPAIAPWEAEKKGFVLIILVLKAMSNLYYLSLWTLVKHNKHEIITWNCIKQLFISLWVIKTFNFIAINFSVVSIIKTLEYVWFKFCYFKKATLSCPNLSYMNAVSAPASLRPYHFESFPKEISKIYKRRAWR